MSIASTDAKKRWNKAHYDEIKASLDKELVRQFKSKCRERNVSIAGALATLMSEYCKRPLKTKRRMSLLPYDTRPKRRKAVASIASQLEDILQHEIMYRENIPPNLQDGIRAEAADYSIEKLEATLDTIFEAY